MKAILSMGHVVAAFFICVTPAHAQEFWQGTRMGMTVAQVKAKVPNAVKATDESPLADGAAGLLVVKDFQLVNRKFKATFYFLDAKLNQVTLTLKDAPSLHDAMSVFSSLTEALRAKYGKEITMDVKSAGTLKMAKAEWMSGQTNVGIICLGIGDDDSSPTLNVNYQNRISTEASKL